MKRKLMALFAAAAMLGAYPAAFAKEIKADIEITAAEAAKDAAAENGSIYVEDMEETGKEAADEPEDIELMIAETYGDFSYYVNNGEVTISRYNSSATTVDIPAEIDGYPVTSIGGGAFSGCSGLTSVVIPDSVTSIGSGAFSECRGLTSVTIGDSVTSIGENAFYSCYGLKEVHIRDIAAWCGISFGNYNANPLFYAQNLYIGEELITDLVIPDGVTSIRSYAFRDCSGLTSVTIPDSVTSIGESAFYGCSNLESLYINDLAAYLNTSYGDGYSNPICYATKLYINNQLAVNVVIPDGVKAVPAGAFSGCRELTSVTIPDSVTSISSGAFYGCRGLTSVTIGDSVTSIGDDAFRGCRGLKEVHISDIAAWCGISFGSDYANPLYNARNLYLGEELITDLVIPDSVTSIGNYAFYNCRGLTSVTIGDSVTSIGSYVFYNCSGLTSVTIGDSVTSIGGWAFEYCSGLMSVTIGDGVTGIGDYVFSNCSGLTSVVIPDNVTFIGSFAFQCCSGLTSVTIPDSVTSIVDFAFYNCNNLTTVKYGGTLEQWNAVSKGSNNYCLTNADLTYKIELTTIDAVKASTDTAWQFTVTVGKPAANSYVYAAVYDAAGNITGMRRVPLEGSGSTAVDVAKTDEDKTAKIFVWNSKQQPITNAADLKL